jgi:hypothetical protein
MKDRTKLLVHIRRISTLLEGAFRNGPDGTLEGKFGQEHLTFIHYSCAFYLSGCLSFLAGEDGEYSWNTNSPKYGGFDAFAANQPPAPRASFASRGIDKAAMNALACIRNAVIHHDGDLSKNRNKQSLATVSSANIPGVKLNNSEVVLETPFLEFVRVATLAVRNFHDEF